MGAQAADCFGSTRSQVRILSPRSIPPQGLSGILRALFYALFWAIGRKMCAKTRPKGPDSQCFLLGSTKAEAVRWARDSPERC